MSLAALLVGSMLLPGLCFAVVATLLAFLLVSGADTSTFTFLSLFALPLTTWLLGRSLDSFVGADVLTTLASVGGFLLLLMQPHSFPLGQEPQSLVLLIGKSATYGAFVGASTFMVVLLLVEIPQRWVLQQLAHAEKPSAVVPFSSLRLIGLVLMFLLVGHLLFSLLLSELL